MIHVSYCFDKNYRQHFGVSVTSLLLNYSGDGADLCIHIVTEEMAPDFQQKLDQLRRRFRANIEVHLLSQDDLQLLPKMSSYMEFMSLATWYRLFLTRILPANVDRLIHLDSDTVVLSDIGELFQTDIQDAPLAGVPDYSSQTMAERLNLRSYVNSGVLLVDLKQWREQDYGNQCLEHASKNAEMLTFADQCALNTFFGDRIFLLDAKWNRYVTTRANTEDPQGAAILHFIMGDKPWHAWYENDLSKYYWQYLDVSPWAGAKAEPPQTLEKAHRLARLRHRQGQYEESMTIYENMLASLKKHLPS